MRPPTVLSATSISTGIWPGIRGERGRVLSVHKKALNLLFRPGGRLVTVVPQAAGRLPNAILFQLPAEPGFSFETLGLKPEISVVATCQALKVPAADLEIHLETATLYPAKPALEMRLDAWPDVLARAALAARQARQYDTQQGLLPLLDYIYEIVLGAHAPEPQLSGLCRRAWSAFRLLFGGLSSESATEVREAVTGLIGLGIGLTPSGDDVLTGLMGFLYHSPGMEAAERLLAGAIEAHAGRTNLISRSYLAHAARGELSDRLVGFVGSLIGGTPEGVRISLRDLLSWGHTSGAETALGALLGAVWSGYAIAEITEGADRHGNPGQSGR